MPGQNFPRSETEMNTEVEWLELNDVGIASTHEQRVLLDEYLTSILRMKDAKDRLDELTHHCAMAALCVARSGIDPRALIVVTEMSEGIHNASL
jgi:hypothetical protein